VGELQPNIHYGYEEFFAHEAVTLLRIKMTGDLESREQLANLCLPGKWPLKQSYVCLYV